MSGLQLQARLHQLACCCCCSVRQFATQLRQTRPAGGGSGMDRATTPTPVGYRARQFHVLPVSWTKLGNGRSDTSTTPTFALPSREPTGSRARHVARNVRVACRPVRRQAGGMSCSVLSLGPDQGRNDAEIHPQFFVPVSDLSPLSQPYTIMGREFQNGFWEKPSVPNLSLKFQAVYTEVAQLLKNLL